MGKISYILHILLFVMLYLKFFPRLVMLYLNFLTYSVLPFIWTQNYSMSCPLYFMFFCCIRRSSSHFHSSNFTITIPVSSPSLVSPIPSLLKQDSTSSEIHPLLFNHRSVTVSKELGDTVLGTLEPTTCSKLKSKY